MKTGELKICKGSMLLYVGENSYTHRGFIPIGSIMMCLSFDTAWEIEVLSEMGKGWVRKAAWERFCKEL